MFAGAWSRSAAPEHHRPATHAYASTLTPETPVTTSHTRACPTSIPEGGAHTPDRRIRRAASSAETAVAGVGRRYGAGRRYGPSAGGVVPGRAGPAEGCDLTGSPAGRRCALAVCALAATWALSRCTGPRCADCRPRDRGDGRLKVPGPEVRDHARSRRRRRYEQAALRPSQERRDDAAPRPDPLGSLFLSLPRRTSATAR